MLGYMKAVGEFLSSHPGMLTLLQKFPSLEKPTKDMLVKFLERTLREENPEAFLVEWLGKALASAEKPARKVRVEQVDREPGRVTGRKR